MLEFIGERVLEVFAVTSTYLVFNDNGTEVLIAKVPIKICISWGMLSATDLVHSNTVKEIDGCYYTVSLLRGGNSHTTVAREYYGYAHEEYTGSEWDRYMYPIHSVVQTSCYNPVLPEMGTLAQYTDIDLAVSVHHPVVTRFTWCQEKTGYDAFSCLYRGGDGVTNGGYDSTHHCSTSHGFRPMLTKLNIGG